jgi:hypothetical protein
MLAVRAQIAGMRMGASPDVYSELFADIAARRKDLEDRRGWVKTALSQETGERKKIARQHVSKTVQKALEDAWTILSSPDVAGVMKRDILLPLVDKVILHKDGVEVIFTPGLFDEAGDQQRDSNCYTTCIGIRTHK